ncbi:MAG: HAD-IC family P-type ATPase [Candidatus Melainabacteria bacterium]|nr:MAG: HAD-IC family P-type ATPase [Candidatus Melainabacteria bacterium]
MLGKIKLAFNPVWVTIFISGTPMFYYALRNIIVNKKITVAVLISIAIISSIFIGEYFAAGEIAFIMALGELLEDYTIKRTNKGINRLISILPQKARIVRDNSEYSVDLEDVKINDIVRIKEGETIPFDGTIIKGSTQIDESTINGESLPKDKLEGDIVYSGTTNGLYVIDIKVDKLTKDSLLQKMIDLVQEAEKNKAPIARIIDKWASYLVPIALLLAISAYFITNDIIRAVTILVVFCPCALDLQLQLQLLQLLDLELKMA